MRRLLSLILLVIVSPVFAADKPNIIFIITDDQGPGDLAIAGNPWLKTPSLDKLYTESIRLTDYHVDPTCSPTRASIMSGRYSTRTGVWHTINARSMMHPDEYSLAEYLKDNGYRTGLFGKWHLGDNAPVRPMDQGFEHVVWHKGGGVTQGPDYFGNDYFDDTYNVNGVDTKFEGYCTDVWFEQAMEYMGREDARPFFAYISTNAPHGPYIVADQYSKPYTDMGVPSPSDKFYGMVENIDENVGKLRAWLDEQGLAENTIFIFTTDNGTARGNFKPLKDNPEIKGFNAGLRGQKGSEHDGGHRVPMLIHWPKGGLTQGRDIDLLCGHIDVMPTLAEMAGLKPIDEDKLVRGPLDGRSIAPLVMGTGEVEPTGVRFVHSQRIADPVKWRKSSVMTEKWRMIVGRDLYDIENDRAQKNNVAAKHPAVIAELRAEYDKWWESLSSVFDDIVRIDLGGAENPTTLMSHDWKMEGEKHAPWHQNNVHRNDLLNGPFMINVVKAGKYRITPSRWPESTGKPAGFVKAEVLFELAKGLERHAETLDPAGDPKPFLVDLPVGPASLITTLTREDSKTYGAYYVKVEYLGED